MGRDRQRSIGLRWEGQVERQCKGKHNESEWKEEGQGVVRERVL